MKTNSAFGTFSRWAARESGHPRTFLLAVATVLIWATLGPIFKYSDTWQLVINTGTTIITFLMVFLIQHTQNRDTAAMQIKLDELIRAVTGAHNALLDLEELEENEIEIIRRNYCNLAATAREGLRAGRIDTESPDVNFPSDKPMGKSER